MEWERNQNERPFPKPLYYLIDQEILIKDLFFRIFQNIFTPNFENRKTFPKLPKTFHSTSSNP